MNRAKWTPCSAVGALLLVSTSAIAQVEDVFGLESTPAAATELSPEADKSVVAASETAASDGVGNFCQCVGETNSPTMVKIEQALAGPLRSQGLDFAEAPLEQVMNVIQDDFEIPIQLDSAALDEIGISSEEPVTINIRHVSLRSALRLMLKQLQLTYVIRNEVLMITTPEAAETELFTCVYDVRDIANSQQAGTLPKGASASGAAAGFDPLIDVITNCVLTETWKENGGGAAEIRPLQPGLLVISQTSAVHEEIRDLLETIRTMQKKSPATDSASEESAAIEPDPNHVVTRSYFLQIGQPAEPEAVRKQIYDLIIRSLPDEQFQRRLTDGQPVVLTILPDRIVLRHTPAVQAKVESLLTESGLAATPAVAEGMGGRGGGIGGGGGFFNPRPADGQ